MEPKLSFRVATPSGQKFGIATAVKSVFALCKVAWVTTLGTHPSSTCRIKALCNWEFKCNYLVNFLGATHSSHESYHAWYAWVSKHGISDIIARSSLLTGPDFENNQISLERISNQLNSYHFLWRIGSQMWFNRIQFESALPAVSPCMMRQLCIQREHKKHLEFDHVCCTNMV